MMKSYVWLFLFAWIDECDALIPIKTSQSKHPMTSLSARGGGRSDDDNMNSINGGDLVLALSKLDKQWSLQQSQPRAPKSRWTKIILGPEEEENQEYEKDVPSPLPREEEIVYLLEPPGLPSCMIVFLGGAGLGQFPHIAYNEFLVRISDKLNAAILAAPYTVGLDHFGIAKQGGEKLRKGILKCQDEKQYSPNIPVYCLGHSLGCKLLAIYIAATFQEFSGIGFLAFNNFSFSQTIGMARDFADQLRTATQRNEFNDPSYSSAGGVLNQLFGFAETAVSFMGLEFMPSPSDMRRLLRLKYTDQWKGKTRIFCFDDDTLDSTPDFVASCGDTVEVSGLPGNHLTPVYLKLQVDDIMTDLPREAKEMASQAMDGFKGVSFGNEEDLSVLVNEVCNFILGKPPSRRTKSMFIPLLEDSGEP
jgi:Protein of unknown function (DUF1350)